MAQVLQLVAFLFVWCLLWDNAYASYLMNRVHSGGCPYTASYLVHEELFKRLVYRSTWQKMEAVNWNVISTANHNFQLLDESLYYVHHMSMFEHWTRKKFGYMKSEEMTAEMSNAAMVGECVANVTEGYHASSIALVPFFGGRPPNVTADLKVNSLGQGNSLVKAEIKAMQLMATLCSVLKQLGQAVVGVVRPEDLILVRTMVGGLPRYFSDRVHIRSITGLQKGANLPFGLIMWAQQYIFKMHCYYRQKHNIAYKPIHTRHFKEPSCDAILSASTAPPKHFESPKLFTHVYYTESDQLLKFKDVAVRDALLAAANSTLHIIGRRCEKRVDSAPGQYLEGLLPTRAVCGNSKEPYELNWPKEAVVRKVLCGQEGRICR